MAYGKTGNALTETLTPGEFWPVLDLGEFQRDYRIPFDYATETVTLHVKHAVIAVINALTEQHQQWQTAGYTTLAEVPQAHILDEYEFEAFFKQAVFCLAKAKLFAQFATMTRKATQESLKQYQDETSEYWQTESIRAIKAIQRQTTITVELL